MTARRIHSDDRNEDTGYETIDEAVAAALAELSPGGILVVHDSDCEQDDADESKCTCEPLELVVGALA